MKLNPKHTILLSFVAIAFLNSVNSVSAVQLSRFTPKIAGSSAALSKPNYYLDPDAIETNRKINALEKYLESHNSPFSQSAATFVLTAENYNLDWRLLPAITGTESTFGKRTAYLSNNPFGWAGGYYQFDSWDDSITTVGKAIRENYMDKWGADSVEKIAPIYAPPSKVWAKNTNFFMNKIDEYAQENNPLTLNL